MKKETKKPITITKEALMNVLKTTYLNDDGDLKTVEDHESRFAKLVKEISEPGFLITRINDGLEIKCFRIEWVEFSPETGRAIALHPHSALGRSLIADRIGTIHTWMTTEVTKVITVAPNSIHFLTKNSEYKITKI